MCLEDATVCMEKFCFLTLAYYTMAIVKLDSDLGEFGERNEGDYICHMQMVEDELKMKIDQQILKVCQVLTSQKVQTRRMKMKYKIANNNKSADVFIATKVTITVNILSSNEAASHVPTDVNSKTDLNDSFADRVILEG